MNSTPPQTAASAAEPASRPARGRFTDYDRVVDDLAYTYEGIFSPRLHCPSRCRRRPALEPTATIPDILPILVPDLPPHLLGDVNI